MPQKSLKSTSKNKSREDSAGRRGGPPRKSPPKCECLQCSLYQAKFKPSAHPCPNFKKKKMTGSKKPGKATAPKKVITSRWVVPPKFDSQRTFPRCRCLPPSGQVSSEQLENSESASSRASSVGGKESKPIYRDENERNLREDFYDALKKQAEKTSAASDSLHKSSPETRKGDDIERQLPKTRPKPDLARDTVRGGIREVGKTKTSPGDNASASDSLHKSYPEDRKGDDRERQLPKTRPDQARGGIREVGKTKMSPGDNAYASDSLHKCSPKTRKGDDSGRQRSKPRPDQARGSARGEIRQVGKTKMSPGETQLRSQDDDIIRTTLPRSVSQGMIGSDSSVCGSGESKSSSTKARIPLSRTGPSAALVAAGRSRSKEILNERKLKRKSTKSPDPNLRITSSSVSFSLSNESPCRKEESATQISHVSKSSTNSRGVLKDPRSTPIRSNSAKLFLEEEQIKKLQETMDKCMSPEIGSSTNRNQQQPAITSKNVLGAVDSTVCSENPVPKGRLPPSRQFMNICAQELAKRKLIARSKAVQELDSTNLFGMERHYEVFSAEAKVDGGTWGIKAYRTIPRL